MPDSLKPNRRLRIRMSGGVRGRGLGAPSYSIDINRKDGGILSLTRYPWYRDIGMGGLELKKEAVWSHRFIGLLIVASLLAGCVGGSSSYSVSGTVVDEDGNAIDGVEIVVKGGKSTTTTTANGGKFTLAGLMGICTLVPNLDGYAFEPTSRQVTNGRTGIQFVGTTEPPELFALVVENGTGGGEYAEGTTVAIRANAPDEEGKVFDKWMTSSGGRFGEARSESTIFTMPKEAVTVTASYRDATMADYFAFDGTTGRITKYQETGKYHNLDEKLDPVIPSMINGRPVTMIGEKAFQGAQITSVDIPEGVTTIEPWAFNNNLLEVVDIPESVTTIGEYAFSANKLKTISLPDDITHIERGVFWLNDLASVTIPTSVTHIGSTSFEDNSLTSIVFPSSVTHIGASAFSSNNLTSLEVPASVQHIGRGAFAYNNGLVTLTIPNNVFIDGHAFYQNSPQVNTIIIGFEVTLGENLLGEGDSFKDAYVSGGPGVYAQEGSNWVKR